MIRNKQELLRTANEMVTMVSEDLATKLTDFMSEVDTNEEELADALGIPVEELCNILEGSTDISIETFAKILIASNHMVQIMPISPWGMEVSPMVRNNRPTPPMHSGRPVPPMGRNGRMMPPMGRDGRMTPPMGRDGRMMPPMPPMGHDEQMPTHRFCGMPGLRRRATVPHNEVALPNADMSRREIIDIINENGWAEEIDMATSTRSELLGFIQSKGWTPVVAEATPEVAPTAAPTDNERIAAILAEELQRNPQLKDVVSEYLRRE